MKLSDRLALLRAGYSKAEINEMIDADAAEIKAEPEAVQSPASDDVMAVLSKMASEIKDLKTAVHKENIANTEMKVGGAQQTAEQILASLINPPEKGN